MKFIVPLLLYTDLIAHLGNKRRLPGNDISNPWRGSELIGDFPVDGWSGFGTLNGAGRWKDLLSKCKPALKYFVTNFINIFPQWQNLNVESGYYEPNSASSDIVPSGLVSHKCSSVEQLTLGDLFFAFLAFSLLFFPAFSSSSLCCFSSSSSLSFSSSSSSEVLSLRCTRLRDDKEVEGCKLMPASAVQSEYSLDVWLSKLKQIWLLLTFHYI